MKIHETKICQILFALSLNVSIVFGTMKYSYWNDEFSNLLKYRLPNNTVVPSNYSIHLSLDADASVINSEVVITIHILKKTKLIYFHYVGTIKEAILLDYKDLEVQHTPTVSFIEDTTTVDLHFKDILEPGVYFLHISCISRPPIGLSNFKIPNFINKTSEKDLYMATTFQPIGARYLFPCWDEPGIKTPFIITVKNYRNYTIYSNMPMIKQHMHNEYFVTRFEKTHEMSTYQVAIAIVLAKMPIVILNTKNTLRCRAYAKSHLEDIYRKTEIVVTEKLASYNMNKIDHIVIPFIQKESIANPGLVVYREDAVMYDNNLDSIAHKLEVKRLITRTLTSAWLNFYISPSWWTYLWFYEGFPIFFQTKISEEEWMKNLFVVQTRHESLYMDTSSNMMALENNSPEDIFLCPHALYVKAPVILYMLENIISPRIFHNSILRYIRKYTHMPTSSDNLWYEMQFALNNLNVTHNNYELKNVMHTWIKQQNYPIVKVEKSNSNKITICLQHLRAENKNFCTNEKWWIPITSTTESEIDFSYTIPYAWLTPQKSCITLNAIRKTDWIIVNIQQTGYYRVNYEQWNWQLIANYLNSEKYINIHVLNRAQLIDDAYYFMMMGELDFHTFLYLTSYLSQETDYIAWYPMLKIFEYLSYLIPFNESRPLKEHMLKIINGVLEKIKYEEFQNDDDLIKCLRQELTKWACLLNDFHCKKVANSKLIKHLKNPKQNKILPSWKDWTYCYGLNIASRITWLKFWNMYNETNNDQILRMFLCSRDITNPQYNMQLLTNSMHRNECINVLYNVIMRNIRTDLIIILANIQDYIVFCTYKLLDVVKVIIIIINNLYSVQQIKTVQTFVGLYIIEILSYIQPIINARLNHVIQQKIILTRWFKQV